MNKKILLCLSAVLLFGCGTKQTPVKITKGDSKITYNDYKMAISQQCASYTDIATINPTILNNKKLQATGIIEKDGKVFISYNTQYNDVRGGLDIVQLNGTSPQLIASIVSENSEFADLKIRNNIIYLVGQKKDVVRNYAYLLAMDITTPASPVVLATKTFDGYYATSIDLEGDKLYVSVPNLGVIEMTHDISTQSFNILNINSSLNNTLFVKRFNQKTIGLGGDGSHQVAIMNNSTNFIDLSSNQQEAPSRMTIKNNILLTNGGNSGLNIIDLSQTTPQLISSMTLEGTGNGISYGACNQLFLAQGEKGLQVKDMANINNILHVGEFDYANDHGSANNVLYTKNGNNHFVFVADGLAGVKIIKMELNSACACSNNHDDDNDDCDDELNDNNMQCKVYDLGSISPRPQTLPNFSTMTPVGTFSTDKLNVIAQNSSNSFPLFPTALKNLKEWYGIECNGYWESKYEGTGKILLGSDDGSKLYLDDLLILDHDGLHSPTNKETNFFFNKRKYKVKVLYYQGPANQIQLELKYKKGNDSYQYMENLSLQ